MRLRALRTRLITVVLGCLSLCAAARANHALHCLWELHGKHNTVYLLGSIHVLRPGDYPLGRTIEEAYAHADALVMEINLGAVDLAQMRAEMLASAALPPGKTLAEVLGPERDARAAAIAGGLGIDLGGFSRFAPWFAAEAISQMQLAALGFSPQSGVDFYMLRRAQKDGKAVTGLETVHDQIALFTAMPLDTQADYLLSSLAETHDFAKEVNDMVLAWQRGDSRWFADEIAREFGHEPALYQTLLLARNRKWLPQIEALLNDERNYLVIVGTGHLVGKGSVVDLLRRDGVAVIQH